MAINLSSETTSCNKTITISPRISFSHSLSQSDSVPVEQLIRSFSPSSSPDFNFCIHHNPDLHQACMADELFSEGKLIPSQLKPPLQQSKQSKQKKQLQDLQQPKQVQVLQQETQQNHQTKSFWGFKRSSSCGNGYARSLCPIPLLSRSNSTGSSTNMNMNTKRSLSSKEGCASKQCSNNQKPPLRKTGYSCGSNVNVGNGVRINPVLNLGFGSLFSSGKKK